MQTMRREINSFVSRKSFKYNDVINSKIVNLNIWHYFQFLNELKREFELSINLRSISDWVRMLKLSIQVKSEDWYQKINIETQLKNQFNFNDSLTLISFRFWVISLIEKMFMTFSLHWVL